MWNRSGRLNYTKTYSTKWKHVRYATHWWSPSFWQFRQRSFRACAVNSQVCSASLHDYGSSLIRFNVIWNFWGYDMPYISVIRRSQVSVATLLGREALWLCTPYFATNTILLNNLDKSICSSNIYLWIKVTTTISKKHVATLLVLCRIQHPQYFHESFIYPHTKDIGYLPFDW